MDPYFIPRTSKSKKASLSHGAFLGMWLMTSWSVNPGICGESWGCGDFAVFVVWVACEDRHLP
jgi:hypothetical protein